MIQTIPIQAYLQTLPLMSAGYCLEKWRYKSHVAMKEMININKGRIMPRPGEPMRSASSHMIVCMMIN